MLNDAWSWGNYVVLRLVSVTSCRCGAQQTPASTRDAALRQCIKVSVDLFFFLSLQPRLSQHCPTDMSTRVSIWLLPSHRHEEMTSSVGGRPSNQNREAGMKRCGLTWNTSQENETGLRQTYSVLYFGEEWYLCFYFVGLVLGRGDEQSVLLSVRGIITSCVCVCVQPSGFVCFCFLIFSSRKQPDENLQSAGFRQEGDSSGGMLEKLTCSGGSCSCSGVQFLFCRFIQSLNQKRS